MKKYKVGLLIGRFQPFHKGHLYLLKKSLETADSIILGIGTANRIDSDNPWTKEERRKMLMEAIKKEDLKKKIIKIVDVNDYLNDDDLWMKKVSTSIGPVDVVIGNNDWVNHLYEKEGVPAVRIPFYKRYIMEGHKVRALIREGKEWQDRVPNYLVSTIRTAI